MLFFRYLKRYSRENVSRFMSRLDVIICHNVCVEFLFSTKIIGSNKRYTLRSRFLFLFNEI